MSTTHQLKKKKTQASKSDLQVQEHNQPVLNPEEIREQRSYKFLSKESARKQTQTTEMTRKTSI